MLYREMFDEVHAPQGLKEEVMNMTRQETTRVVRKVSAAFVIAAVLAVVLAGTALAAVGDFAHGAAAVHALHQAG